MAEHCKQSKMSAVTNTQELKLQNWSSQTSRQCHSCYFHPLYTVCHSWLQYSVAHLKSHPLHSDIMQISSDAQRCLQLMFRTVIEGTFWRHFLPPPPHSFKILQFCLFAPMSLFLIIPVRFSGSSWCLKSAEELWLHRRHQRWLSHDCFVCFCFFL